MYSKSHVQTRIVIALDTGDVVYKMLLQQHTVLFRRNDVCVTASQNFDTTLLAERKEREILSKKVRDSR